MPQGKYKGCTCTASAEITHIYLVEQSTFQTQWDIFDYALRAADAYESDPDVACSDDYSDQIMIETSLMSKLASKFCSGDLNKKTTKNLTTDDIDSTSYQDYTFEFSYTPSDGKVLWKQLCRCL
jgi:hypothetical protein